MIRLLATLSGAFRFAQLVISRLQVQARLWSFQDQVHFQGFGGRQCDCCTTQRAYGDRGRGPRLGLHARQPHICQVAKG